LLAPLTRADRINVLILDECTKSGGAVLPSRARKRTRGKNPRRAIHIHTDRGQRFR